MTALAFYQKVSGLRRVTTREAAMITGLGVPAASMALRRLAAEGLATPLKRGQWLFGNPAMKPGLLVTAAADPYQAYLSGWSALRIHDRIQQIPQRHFAITLGRPVARDIAGTVIEPQGLGERGRRARRRPRPRVRPVENSHRLAPIACSAESIVPTGGRCSVAAQA